MDLLGVGALGRVLMWWTRSLRRLAIPWFPRLAWVGASTGHSPPPLPPRLRQAATRLVCVDCHAGGEPARVVIAGLPSVPGNTMREKRAAFMEEHDHIREVLLLEPRGYPCQNANAVYKLSAPGEQPPRFGFIIMEQNKIYPMMSGHNTICVATALLEMGLVPITGPVVNFTLEAPAGPIEIEATIDGGKAAQITFRNQPAFVAHLGVTVDLPLPPPMDKHLSLDIAYGGMWYAVVDAASVGLELKPEHGKEICRLGELIKTAAREQHPVNHPEFDYPGCDILVFRGPALPGSRSQGRNAVVMSNGVLDWERPETWTGMIDRSPCGSGTCAVMAVLWAKGLLCVGDKFVHESIVGSTFVGRVIGETQVAGRKAITTTISGSAWITQVCHVVVDPTDPFPKGFVVGDIWSG